MPLKKLAEKIVINDENCSKILKVIAIASGKGGVGKSTVAANLAMELSAQGKNVGLLDADIYGPTQPKMLGKEQEQAQIVSNDKIVPLQAYGVKFISISALIDSNKPLVLRAPIVIKLIHQLLNNVQWGNLHYLIVDLPPGTGDIQLSIAQNAQLDGAIIVTTPQDVAVNIAYKGFAMFEKLNVPIVGIIENMAWFICENCEHQHDIFSPTQRQNFYQQYNIPVIGRIPLSKHIAKSSDKGLPALSEDNSNNNVFKEIANNLALQLKHDNKNSLEPEEVVVKNGALHIYWKNLESSKLFKAYDLRLLCKCAHCMDEHTGKKLIDIDKVSANIQITQAEAVGRYGLKVSFSDGHNTGIFTFEKLIKM